MCGLAGVVTWDRRFRVDRQTLAAMSQCIAHRGPDGQGLWQNLDRAEPNDRPQAGLVHRRLAILDPDPRADQPFTDGNGRWIVFNGEIYNFRELRTELSGLRPEHRWKTSGDTEVLLLASEVWGADCVDRLEGMFAFAIWDESQGRLFLARDRMGQKPLYYAEAGDRAIAFASELPALRCVDWVDRTLRPDGIYDYLRRGCQSAGETIYENIFQLRPGWRVLIDERGAERLDAYFDPNEPSADGMAVSASDRARDLLCSAVTRQLVSDVPLGVFLSGGVDSSIVAFAAARALRESGKKLATFSIGFEDPLYDETSFARQVAAHLNTEHHAFTVHPDAAVDLPKIAAGFGEPFADSSALPTHYLSQQTRQHVKVALSGDGGDELFGGYDRYAALPVGERLRRFVPAPLSRRAAGVLARGQSPKSRSARAARFLRTLDQDAARRYVSYGEIFSPALASELLATTEAIWSEDHHLQEFRRLAHGRDVVQTALALDRVTYLPDDLLTKVDRCSMLHALEVRSPFMDHHLVQFAAALNRSQLIGGGKKRLLREAFAADLPPWVFTRRKMGFAVPIGRWFRTTLRPLLRDKLSASSSFAAAHFSRFTIERLLEEHERETLDHTQRLYALLMLELWWDTIR